jgi:hypothetical protein
VWAWLTLVAADLDAPRPLRVGGWGRRLSPSRWPLFSARKICSIKAVQKKFGQKKGPLAGPLEDFKPPSGGENDDRLQCPLRASGT